MKSHPLVIKNLTQPCIDWLLARQVAAKDIIVPSSVMASQGKCAKDGRFDPDPDGKICFVFEEPDDKVFWHPKSGALATYEGRPFALGEHLIDNPATTAFDHWLCIYTDLLEWLQCERDGIVVIKWDFAFDRLRDVTRIAVSEPMLATYKRHMRPRRIPLLAVLPSTVRLSA